MSAHQKSGVSRRVSTIDMEDEPEPLCSASDSQLMDTVDVDSFNPQFPENADQGGDGLDPSLMAALTRQLFAPEEEEDNDNAELLRTAGRQVPDEPMDEPETISSELFLGRLNFPGAEESERQFETYEKAVHQTNLYLKNHTSRRRKNPKEGIRYMSRRLEKVIRVDHGQWTDELVQIGVAAQCVCRLRLADMAMPEQVQMVWLALGRTRLISCNGGLRFLDTDTNTWRIYTGLFPEGMLVEFRKFMNKLEGAFRLIDPKTPRNKESVLTAIAELRSAYDSDEDMFRACLNAALKNAGERQKDQGTGTEEHNQGAAGQASQLHATANPDGGHPNSQPPATANAEGNIDPNGDASNSFIWTLDTARTMRGQATKLIFQLQRGGEVVKNFNEWCDMKVTPTCGVVYNDRAVRYDHGGRHACVVDFPQPKEYWFLSLPSSLLPSTREESDSESEGVEYALEDPVLKRATDDVNLFLRTTFWACFEGLQACRAALGLAKRGQNILQCFIFVGAGGCGLSLFTELLANSLGDELHKFFDPFVFFEDCICHA